MKIYRHNRIDQSGTDNVINQDRNPSQLKKSLLLSVAEVLVEKKLITEKEAEIYRELIEKEVFENEEGIGLWQS